MNRLRPICAIMLAAGALLSEARADVRLPNIFTDNMMLQRDKAIRVWGWAAPGEEVRVGLAGKNAVTKADDQGKWSVELPAMNEGENLELTVAGKNAVALKNVIIGDVWLCSGQSNMEMGLGGCLNAAEDSKRADFSKIRRIKFACVTSGYPEEDAITTTAWQVCSPQTANGFTAVGFYFAREIFQKTGMPIGILDDNLGGTLIAPWIPPDGMEAAPELKQEFDKRQRAIAAYTAQLPKALDELERWIAATREGLAKGTRLLPIPRISANPDRNSLQACVGRSPWKRVFPAGLTLMPILSAR